MNRLAGLLAGRRGERPGPAPLAPGTVLAPGYRVIGHIARGRTFEVYEVWSSERHASCVAKTLRPEAQGDAFGAGLLRREGALLAALGHPHLVRAYETLDQPRLMVIFETLEGQTLEHLIHQAGQRLEAAGLAALGLHLCSAIAYLHHHGLLHLDLKPANIICDAGRAKLIDLTGARAPGVVPRGLGTAAYLAPEQARGQRVGPAADIWGIGAVLYETVTAQVPFDESREGRRYGQLHRRARLGPGPRRDLPDVLAELIEDCLAPDPGTRPALDHLEQTFNRLG